MHRCRSLLSIHHSSTARFPSRRGSPYPGRRNPKKAGLQSCASLNIIITILCTRPDSTTCRPTDHSDASALTNILGYMERRRKNPNNSTVADASRLCQAWHPHKALFFFLVRGSVIRYGTAGKGDQKMGSMERENLIRTRRLAWPITSYQLQKWTRLATAQSE